MKVKIKRLSHKAVIPSYAKPGDAGMDITTVGCKYDKNRDCYVYHTDLAIEIPEGYVGLIFPRSSNTKTEYYIPNSVGVIDSGYRGEITICYKHRDIFTYNDSKVYDVRFAPYMSGDRVAQLMIIPYPICEFEEVDELSVTIRGEGGYGHTGR